MKDKRKFERHERMYGPHFTEECAMKVVAKIESIQKYREEMDKCKAILNQLKDEHKIIKDESVQTDLIRVS